MQYTRSQLQAISTIDDHLQIIACAGSGKTQVVSRRIAEILRSKKTAGITPTNVVAFTFSEKAAAELKDRIHDLCTEELGTDVGFSEVFVGTIHSYCLNLLQQPPVYRFLKYEVLTEVRQRLLIDRNSAKSGLSHTPFLSGGTLQRWKDSGLYQGLLGVLQEGNVNTSKVPKAVQDAAGEYDALLDEKKYIDYSGMVRRAVDELRVNSKLRKKVQDTIRYLVVDEYQDVNPLQEQLIHEIARLGANLCVVGDDDQTIYQWRGSDVRNIMHFKDRYANVKAVRLDDNFRSSKASCTPRARSSSTTPIAFQKPWRARARNPSRAATSSPSSSPTWIPKPNG